MSHMFNPICRLCPQILCHSIKHHKLYEIQPNFYGKPQQTNLLSHMSNKKFFYWKKLELYRNKKHNRYISRNPSTFIYLSVYLNSSFFTWKSRGVYLLLLGNLFERLIIGWKKRKLEIIKWAKIEAKRR